VVALERIGFEWVLGRGTVQVPPEKRGSSHTASQIWETRFQELQQYKQVRGNCLVPQSWKGNRRLADWVSEQRVANNKGLLDAERFHRLNELGFDWDPNNNHWEKCFRQLVEFKQEHGHTNVPQRSGKYAALGAWVRNQRAAKRYKRPIMVERAKRLDEIGFVWMLVEPMAWEKMFAALVEFKRIHGHCQVPQQSREYKRLGKWVNTQRTQNKRGKILPARKQLLDSMGFIWDARPNLATAS
jgi:Helicase associated domain